MRNIIREAWDNPRLFALAFLVLLASSASASLNLTDDLIRYWEFNDGSGAVVSAQVGYDNITIVDNASWESQSPSGSGFSLFVPQGATEGHDIGDGFDTIGTGDFTVNLWINYTSGSAILFAGGTNPEFRDFFHIITDSNTGEGSTFEVAFRSGSSGVSEMYSDTKPGEWAMLTVTRSGTTARFYVDGVEVDDVTGSDVGVNLGVGANHGEYLSFDHRHLNRPSDGFEQRNSVGYYRSVGVWDVVLSESQIEGLYNNGSGLAYPLSSEPEPEIVEVVIDSSNGTGSWSVPEGVFKVDVLLVAGGGGAGRGTTDTSENGGGGGAGGLVFIENWSVTSGSSLSYSVGAGGLASDWSGYGYSGSDTVFGNLTALGGGGGGGYSGGNRDGIDGGSGGGAGGGSFWGVAGSSTQPSTNDGYTNTGFGHDGASSTGGVGSGGGGGAGSAASLQTGGSCLNVWGSDYACGGHSQSDGSSGAANTGSGGNAQAADSDAVGGDGADGIIVIRYTVADSFVLTAVDAYDSAAVDFNATINGTVYESISGSVIIPLEDLPSTFDINYTAAGYFGLFLEDFDKTTEFYDAELVQAYASFSCFELYTNDTLTCAEPGPHIRKAGSFTDDVNVTGYYPVSYSYTLEALDNETFNVEGFYDHELTINASDYEGNPLTNFTLSVESTISSFNVTDNNTGTVVLPLLQGYLYNVTITQNVPEGEDRNNSIETQTFNITTSSESYQFNLSFPRLYIRVFDEQTNLILTDSTTTMTFQSGNSSFSLNTTNGLLNLTGEEAIQTGSYEVLFENPSYNPRTYSLTYNRTFPQSLDAYLVPLEAPSTIFTIEDRSTRNPIEGATVTIQRFVNGTLTTVLSLQSDITGRVGFDYIPNRRYEFTITKSGYETRSFNLDPILFSSYLILLDSNIVIGETGGDFSGVGITFTQSGFKESNQNNFSMSFSDSKGRLVRYGYNLSTTTTGQLTSQEGTNAYGSILPVTISIPDVPLQDQLVVDYYYERSDGTLLTYRTSYSITQVNPYSNQTWVGMRDTAAQIPILDRAAVVVIATGSLTALAFTFIGLSGAALAAMFILGFFALTGFINGWVIAVPLIGLAFILLGRGTQ